MSGYPGPTSTVVDIERRRRNLIAARIAMGEALGPPKPRTSKRINRKKSAATACCRDRSGESGYAQQSAAAEANGTSNCPLCASGHPANKGKIWKFAEMDADRVSAWSKGGGSSAENCQMLCVTHNRAKGNL
jgi:hypothetical protein